MTNEFSLVVVVYKYKKNKMKIFATSECTKETDDEYDNLATVDILLTEEKYRLESFV